MKKITAFENAIANQVKDVRADGINATAFYAYCNSIKAGNDLIDFSEVIWDDDVEPIAETFRQNDITEFTISSTMSSLISIIAAFEKQGFKMAGITEVNVLYSPRRPAIRMMSI